MILANVESLGELRDKMFEYQMKFDVIGWRNKSNTKHVGFVNDRSVIKEGEVIRDCQHAQRLHRDCYCKDYWKMVEASINEQRRFRTS